jgi:hypothetical protein
MSALRLSWDTPYRIFASFLSIGCACTLFGWIAASSPLDALGHVGGYLGLPQSQEFASGIGSWLSSRKETVVPIASVLMFLGILANGGDGSGRGSFPGPWKGSATALIALTVIWTVEPGTVPGALVLLALILLTVYVIRRFARNGVEVGSWLAWTFLNLLGSALYVFLVVVWMVGRTPPRSEPK